MPSKKWVRVVWTVLVVFVALSTVFSLFAYSLFR